MITSKSSNKKQAYVWIFLPNQIRPVVAGRITKKNNIYYFTYGQSYLQNETAIPLSPFELPLQKGNFFPEGMNIIPSCLRDAAPDSWGRRLIDFQFGHKEHDELDYFLLSSNNRIGALDFQLSSQDYQKKETKDVTFEELLEVTALIEAEKPIPKELEYALLRGTSIGGARPKALIQHKGKEYIAKFGLTHDTFNVIKAEYIGMKLAKIVGINAPHVELTKVMGKDIYLVERFDREYQKKGVTRRLMLSGLSILQLDEMEARYASYIDLAEIIRQKFESPHSELFELYKRLIFNILIGNTDDHARNHSAFWDGKNLKLTPAYDLCPQPRTGQEASQAMNINGTEGNLSKLNNVLSVSHHFQISTEDARELINKMLNQIEKSWHQISHDANLSEIDHQRLWKRSIFNPFIFQGW